MIIEFTDRERDIALDALQCKADELVKKSATLHRSHPESAAGYKRRAVEIDSLIARLDPKA